MIAGDTLPTIRTARLSLRWLEERDVSALYRIFGDAETVKYWSSPPLRDERAAATLLAEIQDLFRSGSLFQWGVADRANDEILGTCTLAAINIPHRRAELGFAVARTHWRCGYASEAIDAIIRFAFTSLNLHRLEADVDPRNGASMRCLEKVGFRKEGYARERYHLGDDVHDAVLYGLLRHDFGTAPHVVA